MTPEIFLAALCIIQGLAISWQWNRIQTYRNTLALATFALEKAYIHITEEIADEADTD